MQKFKLLILAASRFLCIESCSIKQVAAATLSSNNCHMDPVADLGLNLIDPILRKCLELEPVRRPSVNSWSILLLTIHAATDSRLIS